MAAFLTTNGISLALEELVRDAQKIICFISPYVKVNTRLQTFIRDADRRGVKIILLYGKNDMKPEERNWISPLTNKEVRFVPNLHAKCYLNENTAIITSMNLYEFSQQNNEEMGILVSKDGDADIHADIIAEYNRLYYSAEDQTLNYAPQVSKSGHCIRCGEPINFDTDKPLCYKCYQSWARYADSDYTEKYCHRCGKENATSMAKPLCRPCFRRAGDV